ncbi:MAG TPA: hypothetical protein VGB73_17660 [Pyrinomonadaceae bacterium]
MQLSQRIRRWRLGLLAGVGLMMLAVYPQVAFRLARGGEWNGTTANAHGDEVVYAAYVNALIDGRPRRNDPYTGNDDAPDVPRPESYFSAQFAPAYLTAFPARLFGLSTAQAFVALSCLAALASALAVFYLLDALTGDERFAATGALVILCLGSAHQLLEQALRLDVTNNYLPFLRRYQPGVPFPFFFLFCALVWHMLASDRRRAALISAAGAGLTFALLVFSYFYLWTAASAWLACLAVSWLIARPEERRRSLERLAVVGAFALAALPPYFLLLSKRLPTMDAIQLLTPSHAPDLLRIPELYGLLALAALFIGVRRGRFEWRERVVLFASAFALTPFVVFNQQIVTGRSLQPFHYSLFIANYTGVTALVLVAWLWWRAHGATERRLPTGALVCLWLAALSSGALETVLASRRFMEGNVLRDEARPAALKLAQLARERGGAALDTRSVVLATDYTVGDTLPTVASQPLLWAPHLVSFTTVSVEEDRERLSQYLYYTGVSLADVDAERFDALDNRRKYLVSALIRRTRHNPKLSVDWTPIRPEEVREALQRYSGFVASFDRERAARPLLSYVLTSLEERADLTNLDRWYERDSGERIGRFILYRVRLRQ